MNKISLGSFLGHFSILLGSLVLSPWNANAANEIEFQIQFKSGNTLIFEVDGKRDYALWKDGEKREKPLRYGRMLSTFESTESQTAIQEKIDKAETFSPETHIRRKDSLDRNFTWYEDSEGTWIVYDDGEVIASAKDFVEDLSTFKFRESNGNLLSVQSFKIQGDVHTTIIKNTSANEELPLDMEFHHFDENSETSIVDGKLEIKGVLTKVNLEDFMPIPRVQYQGLTFEIRQMDSKHLAVTRESDGLNMKVAGSILEWMPDNHPKEGLFRIDGTGQLIDLVHFDEEVKRSMRLIASKKIEDEERQQVQPQEWVLEHFTDLVEDSRNNPKAYQESNNPLIIRQLAEAVYSRKSAVLLGKAGTGKSSTIRAFAREVGLGHVAGIPRSTRIIEVSPYTLAAGTTYTGQIELKVATILSAARATGWIIFFDETHSLAGIGTHSQQANDITQYLKGSLEKGELQILGTDTDHEFYSTFGKDPAFIERFEVIKLAPPTREEAKSILRRKVAADGEKLPENPDLVLDRLVEYSQEFDILGAQPRACVNLMKKVFAMRACERKTTPLEACDIKAAACEKYKVPSALFDPCQARENLNRLDEALDQQLIGSQNAKSAVLLMWTVKLSGLSDPNYVNSLLFVGPNGVGKTTAAKISAQKMGYESKSIEMNRFSNGDAEGLRKELYQALLKSPFHVFILDEFEKAHPVVQDSVLSILQSGEFSMTEKLPGGAHLTRDINAKHSLFILTTNAASDLIERETKGRPLPQEQMGEMLEAGGITRSVLSRIRQIIPMHRPSREQYKLAIRQSIQKVLTRVKAQSGFEFQLSNEDAVVDTLGETYNENTANYRIPQNLILPLENILAKQVIEMLGTDSGKEPISIEWDARPIQREAAAYQSMFL